MYSYELEKNLLHILSAEVDNYKTSFKLRDFTDMIEQFNVSELCPKYDIVFIGRLDTGSNEHRIKILNFLIKEGVNIKIWTWLLSNKFINKYTLLNNHVVGSAYGKEMVKILSQSKIALNIHDPSVPYGGNMRLFEIPATKSLQIADKCPQDWFKDGDEIVLYKNNQDLLQKINYFIDNDEERERIAKNGYEKLVRKHQYKHRVKKIFESISITS